MTETIWRYSIKAYTCGDNDNFWITGYYLSTVLGTLSWAVFHNPGNTAAR
jgi:hypothetical protein